MTRRPLLAAALALALASLFPPAQAAEGRMEASLLDWTRAHTAKASPAVQAVEPPPAPQTATAFPWEAEKILSSALPEVLVAEESGRADKAALQEALEKWATRQDPLDRAALTDFLAAHPQSAWKPALLGNLGLLALEEGRFTRAIADLEAAWRAGRDIQHPGVKALVDRIGGELVRLRAQLGHREAVAAFLPELERRALVGAASESRAFARENLWRMQHPDSGAFQCGPLALAQLRGEPLDPDKLPAHETSGYRLDELAALAQGQGQNLAALRREAGSPIPVPAVVHWKSGHYAALLETREDEKGRRYHVRDAAMGKDYWVSRAALEEESSGYFLAAAESVAATVGWRAASVEESARVIGAGPTSGPEPDDPPEEPPCDPNNCLCNNTGMAGVGVQSMKVSLTLSDAPLAYHPPKGPSVPLSLHYNQRASAQLSTFIYSNLGPNWTWRGLAYISDNLDTPGSNVQRYMSGGGIRQQKGYDAASGAFARDVADQSRLVRVSANPVVYERHLADGGKEIYSLAQTQGATRRVFLTKVIDAAGNALTYHYDGQIRLTSLTDATGGVTKLEYGHTDPLKITAFTDPAGRRATFAYDRLGRLASITDAVGIISQFIYRGESAFIERLKTPYGESRFDFGESSHATRWLELTNAQGQTERVESNHYAPGVLHSEAQAPVGMNVYNSWLNYRNTYHWDAEALAQYPGDYTKAEVKHWFHGTGGGTSNVLESIKHPLESRIWYNYPGQTSPTSFSDGTCDKPSAIGRVLPGGDTQLTRMEYNDWGRMTRRIDPVGRETQYEYAANGIDLVKVRQKTAQGWDTLAQITWNTRHRPLTVKDAAGQTTQYTWNAAGQLTSQTNALKQTTKYEYNGKGQLVKVTNPLGRVAAAYTYDTAGNVATETDSEGYVLKHQYDKLDRRTRTTYPDGTTTEYTWNKLDITKVKDRNGKVVHYQYDAARRLIKATDALRSIEYDYDAAGRLIGLTDGNGQTTTWTRDLQGRIVAKVTPDGARTSWAFDSAGRLHAHTDALFQSRVFSRDNADSITDIRYVFAREPTGSVNYTWDAYYPRLAAMKDSLGTTRYTYKQPGELGALQGYGEDGPRTNDAVYYAYDALGRQRAWYLGGAWQESMAFDALGRVSVNRIDALGGQFQYSYLGDTGQLAYARLGNLQRTYAYEPNTGDRRLKSINFPSFDSRGYVYTSAPEDLITSLTEFTPPFLQQRAWTYGYDAIDRLQSADRSDGAQYDYVLDKGDNITGIIAPEGAYKWKHDAGNKIAQAPYKYDANGNRTEDSQHTYKWDAENRLVQIGYKANSQKSTEFKYDGQGRRVAIIEKTGATRVETRYTWCGDRICQARDGKDQPLAYYFSEGAAYSGSWAKTRGARNYYVRDHLGSVRDVLDQAGKTLRKYDYDPYGNLINDPQLPPEFGYAGMQYHAQSGLYLTKYRVYEPGTGRWLSRDPIGEEGGVNLYGYVYNNPVKWVDPLGLIILVCNRPVKGFPFIGNHAYPWDTERKTSEGMRGSSGSGADASDEKGPRTDSEDPESGDLCNAVEGSEGKEDDVMWRMRRNQNNGPWIPFLNDCHTAVRRAVENSGLNYPGAPGGRFGDLRGNNSSVNSPINGATPGLFGGY